MRMHVFNDYTYTLETVIQAGRKNMVVASVPVRVNADIRPSRLIKSVPRYIRKSVFTMLRIFVVYRPFRFFMAVGGTVFGVGVLLGLRFLALLIFRSGGSGHVQSLILASILLGIGFQAMLTAFLADLLAVNRTLLEDIEFRAWKSLDREKRAASARPRAHRETTKRANPRHLRPNRL